MLFSFPPCHTGSIHRMNAYPGSKYNSGDPHYHFRINRPGNAYSIFGCKFESESYINRFRRTERIIKIRRISRDRTICIIDPSGNRSVSSHKPHGIVFIFTYLILVSVVIFGNPCSPVKSQKPAQLYGITGNIHVEAFITALTVTACPFLIPITDLSVYTCIEGRFKQVIPIRLKLKGRPLFNP